MTKLLTREEAMSYLKIGSTIFNEVKSRLNPVVVNKRKMYDLKELTNYLDRRKEICQEVAPVTANRQKIRNSNGGGISSGVIRRSPSVGRSSGLEEALAQTMKN